MLRWLNDKESLSVAARSCGIHMKLELFRDREEGIVFSVEHFRFVINRNDIDDVTFICAKPFRKGGIFFHKNDALLQLPIDDSTNVAAAIIFNRSVMKHSDFDLIYQVLKDNDFKVIMRG